MKNNFKILTIFVFVLTLSNIKAQNCSRTVKIDNHTEICLPKIKGLKEVGKDTKYRNLAQDYAILSNKVLGFYIEKSIPNPIVTASIFMNKRVQQDMDNKTFEKMSEVLAFHLKKSYDPDYLLKLCNLRTDLEVDRDILIDSYSLNRDIKTYVILGKRKIDNKETVILKTLNLIHLKNKMLISLYVIKYNNSNSINKLKQKSDYFMMNLLDNNN